MANTKREMTIMVEQLEDRELTWLIAIALSESRRRLELGHLATVNPETLKCARAEHFHTKAEIAAISKALNS